MGVGVTTAAGRAGLAAIVAEPSGALLAFDYDGTLAPIVADPAKAVPHPEVVGALAELASYVGGVAVVTGRPARVAVELAALDMVRGLEGLVVLGHYGLERWDAATGAVETVDPPPGLDKARDDLPGLLASLDLSGADIEDKGLSVAVHVRRLADADRALERLDGPLRQLAADCGLMVEPGRRVIELRSSGMDKGRALRRLVEEREPRAVAFTGDDLGDLAAFAEVERLRREGLAGLLVCSGSAEESALAERADLVVDGPAGVVGFIKGLVAGIRQKR